MKSGLHSSLMPATRIISASAAASSEVFLFNMVNGQDPSVFSTVKWEK